MMRKSILVFVVGVLVMAVAGTAGAMGIEAAVGGWRQNPSGSLGYEAIDDGDILDMEEDFRYSEEDGFMGRVVIDMPLVLPNIYLMATNMEFSGTGHVGEGFKFGDISFDPGDFESEIKLSHLDVALFYGIPFLETATLDLLSVDIGINIRLFDYDLSIHQELSGLDESKDGFLPVPMVFLRVRVSPIDELSFEVEGRGLSYDGNDMYSIIGRVKINIFGPLFAAGGYRYDKLAVDEDDVELNVEFSGPFLEAGFSF